MSAAISLVMVLLASRNIVETARPKNEFSSSNLFSTLLKMRPTSEVIQDTKREAPELFINLEEDVRSLGYPLERHEVHTEDGYILTMHRIPRGRTETNKVTHSKDEAQQQPPAVLLQHGMTVHSDFWVATGPTSPAIMLADLGYDVWMNNMRGSMYSKKHTTMKSNDPRFWMFRLSLCHGHSWHSHAEIGWQIDLAILYPKSTSGADWHEAGYYDVPAAIDYVLNTTGQEKLYFFGHSMGNLLFYVAMSTRPEYNEKIRLQIALAPSVYFDDAKSMAVRLLYPKGEALKQITALLPRHELNFHTDEVITFLHRTCGTRAPLHKLCVHVFASIYGVTNFSDTANITRLFCKTISSTSTFVFEHYSQIILAGEVIMMDHGKAKNIAKYGSPNPPKYPVQNVTAPIALYAADGDYFTSVTSVERLAKVLPNVVSFKVIHEKYFNHADFGIHPRIKEILWNHIFELIKKY